MRTVPRSLQQPGPRRAQRWISAEGPARTLAFSLEPGLTINEAIARPMIAAGFAGGTVELAGGALGPFTYVMPALSADPRYAAFYSQSYHPPGRTTLERASATFGTREDAPFIHCHGVWVEEDGSRRGGHVMPLDTTVLEPIRARAFGTGAAAFAVLPDQETNFSLFTPVTVHAEDPSGARVILLKVQPNETMEDFSRGSLPGARHHGCQHPWGGQPRMPSFRQRSLFDLDRNGIVPRREPSSHYPERRG